ncbi:SBBP repeat-containing protein [Hymenobacter sp. 15J16-1T3B]|uniref:SBBP repeat-containing protein n=1 Tax=Hymenobacter sp. 15J16-1T3B TaxID=2886941 RepID=UPI001D0F9970|nr:SBBP repeat-containing protein [Hymenobacter sp. 15J16-1T3B]MCC3155726.1 SBBP repeat-containing protein [Hymenobacter sp. 15J16-1T3B]
MTRSLFFLLHSLSLLMLLAAAPLQAQTWDWSRAIGASAANGSTYSQRSTTDAAGNSYLTGYFVGTVVFGTTTLSSLDRFGALFVAKASPSGQWLWAAQASVASGQDIAVDAAGNVYVTGSFTGPSATVGSTTLTSTSTASYPSTAFVAKLNSAGQWLWAAQNTGTGALSAMRLAVDAAGSAYVTGAFFTGTATFGATTLTGVSPNPEPYVAKLSPSGQWLWAVQGSGTGYDVGSALAADPAGGVVVAGTFNSPTLTLGTSTLTTAGAPDSDLFVAKLSAAGQWQWVNKVSGSLSEYPDALTADANGNFYLAGSFNGSSLVVGSSTFGNSGGTDLFVAKLSAAGQWQWAVKAGGNESDKPAAVRTDAAGTVYVAGTFASTGVTLGSTTLSNTAGGNFVARLSSGGQWLWATNAGTGITTGLGLDASGNMFVSGAYVSDMTLGSTVLSGSSSFSVYLAQLSGSGQWQWALVNNSGSVKQTFATATDASGNAYVVGAFLGTCAFGSTTLTSGGQYDAYVAKMDPTGQWLWVVRLGGSGAEEAHGVAVDAAGNVYVAGQFNSQSMFVGTTALGNSGGNDVFVAKLNGAGQWQWAVKAGGNGFDSATGIAADAAGNLSVAGYLSGNSTVFGTFSLNTLGASDGFVARLSSSGQWLWVRQVGGPLSDYALSTCLDAAGNTYVGGYFGSPTLTLDSQTLTNRGYNNAFVGKLNANGIWQWSQSAGGGGGDGATALGLDAAGNLFVAGSFSSRSATFGSFTLASADSSDLFVARLSTGGQWQWVSKAGTTGSHDLNGLAVDAGGNAYVTGRYRGRSLDFGNHVLPSSGLYADMYVAKIDGAGQWQWATRGGGTGSSVGYGVAVDGNGNAYVAGTYSYGPLTLGATTLDGGLGYNDTGFLARVSTTVTATRAAAGRAQLAEAYPNPFGQTLAVQLPQGGPTELRLTDALGRVRLQRRVVAGAGQTVVLPEAAAWPAGVYLLTVRQGAQQQVLKVVRR